MSDYDDYDYGSVDGSGPKERGLSRETVENIYRHVLGVVPGSVLSNADAEPETPGPNEPKPGPLKQGPSGKLKDRPRKQFSAKAAVAELDHDKLARVVQEALRRKLAVNRNGTVDERLLHEIIVDVQIMKAAKGSTAAARFLDTMNMRTERLDARRRASEFAQWKDRKARYTAIHERAKTRQRALNWECPHPDDIVLEPGNRVRIEGPMTPEDLVFTRQVYERARFWLMNLTYEAWLQKRRLRTHPICPHAHAELVSNYMFRAEQQLLPPRLRMTPAQVEALMLEWSSIAGRALHDLLRTKAAAVGMPVPPRALRIPFTLAQPLSEELVPDVPTSGDEPPDLRAPAKNMAPEVFRIAWAELMRMQRDQFEVRG
jgi:hypothetical protein